MSKIFTMHQPNYLPWIGFFSKASKADYIIIYDTAGYTNSGVINRNKIRTDTGWCYLTVPVSRRFHAARINEVTMPDNRRWRHDHWKSINQYYGRSHFFDDHRVFFDNLYQEDSQYLYQFNEKVIRYLLDCFHLRTEVLRASELGIDVSLKGTAAIIDCLKRAGASHYLSGPSGKYYLELEKFSRNGIDIEFSQFNHPIYRQCYPGFEPGMSAIDLLFNKGPEAEIMIKASSICRLSA